ncbi:CYTH domain-containing protein [Planococcus lenghuensis]|uniref:Adenylate cyclase n=1 Tax=Planococcus lenghuensis TaxID=2213202 RepID=A0A1Q2L0K5_9BACL|nr:CYTH domain-containing protein [Planococcus lenghuensis]AQQ53904.1 adenylate cyclase [Planococcus lenghuensis]
MTKELEIEYKNMLTKDEYQRLLSHFNFTYQEAHVQVNHYFDTPDGQLRKQKCALRIRQTDKEIECTLKTPAPDGNYEITDELTEEQAAAMLNGEGFFAPEVTETLESLNIAPADLQPFGTLTTRRLEAPHEEGLLVFDHSEYGTEEDYELEYETEDAVKGKERFEQFLKEHHIPARPADKKIARLVKYLTRD